MCRRINPGSTSCNVRIDENWSKRVRGVLLSSTHSAASARWPWLAAAAKVGELTIGHQLHIVQIVASVADEAAGPSYSVSRLCSFLGGTGARVELHTVGARQAKARDGYLHQIWDQDWSRIPFVSRLYLSKGLHNALTASSLTADVLHAHGLWLMPNVYPEWVARRARKPLVISPRGMLGGAALQFSTLRKRLFWWGLQRSAVGGARCLHATSLQEYDDIREFGLRHPIAIVPNGIDVPAYDPPPRNYTLRRRVLYLGRLHPKKGIDQLIAAWRRVEDRHPDWQLDIVGPLTGTYPDELRRMIAQMAVKRAQLMGPFYGADKTKAYQRSDLFVLPTLNENFGNTVAEALSHGVPVITTKGAPWGGLEAHHCGWWVDHGVSPLAAALDEAMNLDTASLKEMGKAGHSWMEGSFGWQSVASSMLSVYLWLSRKEARPPCVMD
jgi:glycosyltransferase involved in cell wall biosynthesis